MRLETASWTLKVSGSVFATVLVPAPTLTLTDIDSDPVPEGQDVTLTPVPNLDGATALSGYFVDWGDGTRGSILTHSYAHGGSFLSYAAVVSMVTSAGVIEAGVNVLVSGANPIATPGTDRISFTIQDDTSGGVAVGPGQGDGINAVENDTIRVNLQDEAPGNIDGSVGYTIDWGDQYSTAASGGSLTLAHDNSVDATETHVYAHHGTYTVTMTATDGSVQSLFVFNSTNDLLLTTSPDQLVPQGSTVAISANYSGAASDAQLVAFVDVLYGDGDGPQQLTVTPTGGGSGTVTGQITVPNGLGPFYPTITLNDLYNMRYQAGNSFSLTTYTATLTVGGVVGSSNPAVSDANLPAAFLPLDDGLSSTGTPENQLSPPDSTDPRLVDGSVAFAAPLGTSGFWHLDFPSTVRVWKVVGTTLTPITSTTDYPITMTYSRTAGVALEFQGAALGAVSAMVAKFMPATAPEPAVSKLTPNVANPLIVDSIVHDVAGAPLSETQKRRGIYVPIDKGYAYPVPIAILPFFRGQITQVKFLVPAGVTVFRQTAAGPVPVGLQAITISQDTSQLFEVAAIGPNPVSGNIRLVATGPGAPVGTTLEVDSIPITTFQWTGPKDVPQFGNYDYKVTFPPHKTPPGTAEWLLPNHGGFGFLPSGNDNESSAFMTWGTGGVVGDVIYRVIPNYIWNMHVNIVAVQVGTPVNAFDTGIVTNRVKFYPESTPDKRMVLAVDSFNGIKDALTSKASIVFKGPPGNGGVAHITAGFIQNCTIVSLAGTYDNGSTLHSILESQQPYWDAGAGHIGRFQRGTATSFYHGGNARYNGESGTRTKSDGNIITTSDSPAGGPLLRNSGHQLKSVNIIFDFNLYVVAVTDEETDTSRGAIPGEAVTHWRYDASGTVDAGNSFSWKGTGPNFENPIIGLNGGNPVPKPPPWEAMHMDGIAVVTYNNSPILAHDQTIDEKMLALSKVGEF